MATIGVLGPVAVIAGDGAKLGGVKPRAILAYLALHAGRDITVSALIDAVWGEEAPDTVVNTLQVNVSALRRALAPYRVAIDRTTGAYRLDIAPTEVDAHCFEGLVAEGRAALRGQRPERALELLTDALAMWRGRPFDGLESAPFVESVRPALEHARASAAIEQVECLLRLGRFADAVTEAERVVAREPFDERAWAVLMTSCYWAGRQADALEAFQRARRVLADELGLEPGPDLVALERALLDHSLPAPRRPVTTSPEGSADRSPLPAERTLVGRAELIDQVATLLDVDDRVVSLIGLGGIGKTSVAIAVAHQLAREGVQVWFVDVSAATDAPAAADAVVRAVGAEASSDPLGAVAAWAGAADGLLVLDNLEQVAGAGRLITALHQTSTRLRVLVTSRRAVRVRGELVAAVPPLPVDRDTAPDAGARALFARRAAQIRPDLTDIDDGVAAEICGLTAGIPLAIELAALQLRALSPEQLLGRLRTFTTAALDLAATDDYPDRQRSLRAVIEATTSTLPDDAAAVLLRCSVTTGPMSLELIEAACCVSGIDALTHLGDLIESGLVTRPAGSDVVVVPVPVRQHLTDRADATARERAEDDVIDAVHEMLAAAAGDWYGPSAEQHRAQFNVDAAAIDTSVAVLVARGAWSQLAEVAFLLAPYWLQQSRFNDALVTLDTLTSAELSDELAVRVKLLCGTFASYVGRDDAAELLSTALADLPSGATPDRLVVNGWCCLGAFHAHRRADDELRRCVDAARAAAVASGDDSLVALARDFAGYAASHLGDTTTAIALTLEAIADARRNGDRHALTLLLGTATEAMLESDRFDEAKALTDEMFELGRHVDLGVAMNSVLQWTGATEVALGHGAAAQGLMIEHLRFVVERMHDPLGVGDSLATLAAARSLLGDTEAAARIWGAAAAFHSDHDVDPERRRLRIVQRRWTSTREAMGAARFDALMLAGTIAADRVVEELLGRDDRDGGTNPPSRPSTGSVRR